MTSGTSTTREASPRVAIIGNGRMGRTLVELAPERGLRVCALIDARNNPGGAGITKASLNGADVAIEFTEPDAAVANIEAAIRARVPLVVGTTGWYSQLPHVREMAAREIGSLFVAPNFSIGVAVFARIAARAGHALSSLRQFEAHIVETHHSAKKDAPSGTAAMLQGALGRTLGRDVPVTSIRVGAVPGTHEILFDAPYEQIRLTHEARDRRVFADGALTAARWLIGRAGVFGMDDLLDSLDK